MVDPTQQNIGEDYMITLELPQYHRWHASISTDLCKADKQFDRNIVGITKTDADRIYDITGCRNLESYLIRIALNDAGFTKLLQQALGGKNHKVVSLIT